MANTIGRVLSVKVGVEREFEYRGRPAKSAIWKSPAAGRIAARGVNLAGDQQADRKAHGGPDNAIYAYALEDIRWWEQQIGRSLAYGEFGENLTTEGIEGNNVLVGERWEPAQCWRRAAIHRRYAIPRLGRP
jgi:MOSC domain-containing protein YiiM